MSSVVEEEKKYDLRVPVKRMRYWHEYVIDLMLTNPQLTQGQIAAMLNRSEAWLSRIVNSDMFRAQYEARRFALNAEVDVSITEKLQSLADIALDQMTERVVQQGNSLPMGVLQETCALALKSLGYGAAPRGSQGGQGPQVNVHVHQATPDSLAEARARLRMVTQIEVSNGPEGAGEMPALEQLHPGDDYSFPEAGEEGARLRSDGDARGE